MTTIDKLKQQRRTKREAPPSIEDRSSIIDTNPRDDQGDPPPAPETKEPLKALSFKLPESIVREFGDLAYEAFGATHGAKQQLMLRMFESYKASVRVGGDSLERPRSRK